MNYFKLFSLEANYIVDQALLKKSYLSLQIKYHPDKAKTPLEQRNNLEQSMLINEAFKVLQDDYLRAEYLLKLKGVVMDDSSLKNAIPMDQLEQILDQYEVIEETNDPLLLKSIEKEKIAEQEELKNAIDICFAQNNLKEALDLALRLKYLTNLVGNIRLKIKNANS